MKLTEKTCIPCQGGIPPLTYKEAVVLLGKIPGWILSETGDKIMRSFSFSDFSTALEFVNRVGDIAEADNHHPDISFGWGYAEIVVYTHKIKGLHENDFILAAKVSELV